MTSYERLCQWSRMHDTITNRVQIVNQLHECQYDGGICNPARVRSRGGMYHLTYCGVELVSWKIYDERTTSEALRRADELQEVCWQGRRQGYLRLYPGTLHL